MYMSPGGLLTLRSCPLENSHMGSLKYSSQRWGTETASLLRTQLLICLHENQAPMYSLAEVSDVAWRAKPVILQS